jgi:hypothetical protein
MMIIWIASLIALALGGACLLVLRNLTRPQISGEATEVDWQVSSPIDRLLDPAEFEFLRSRGLSEQHIQKFRAKRRSLFRAYMRRLTLEFNLAYDALKSVVVTAQVDRPDLVAELGRQRLRFYRGLIGVEVRLGLNALGFESVPVPTLDLIRPLERLHLEFCNLVPDLAGLEA